MESRTFMQSHGPLRELSALCARNLYLTSLFFYRNLGRANCLESKFILFSYRRAKRLTFFLARVLHCAKFSTFSRVSEHMCATTAQRAFLHANKTSHTTSAYGIVRRRSRHCKNKHDGRLFRDHRPACALYIQMICTYYIRACHAYVRASFFAFARRFDKELPTCSTSRLFDEAPPTSDTS